MIIKIITDLDEELITRWERFVIDHPNGSFFQSHAAHEFFKSVDGYEPVLIAAEEENEIVGILSAVIIKEPGIKGHFSRRCIVWGGPLAASQEAAELLIEGLNNYLNGKVIYTEFRNLFDLSNIKTVFERNGFVFKEHLNFILEIDCLEKNLKKLNKTKKWEVGKGSKEGAYIVEAIDVSEVKEFYTILKNLYEERVKKPLPNFNFFKQFFSKPNLGKYFLVKYKGKTIGGTMCPIFKDTIYEWYECSLDKEYKNLYPGTLATWAPIEYACNNGLKYFDFLGAGSPDSDYGVREFKSKFGGREVRYGRYIRINNKLLYNIGKLGLKIYSAIK